MKFIAGLLLITSLGWGVPVVVTVTDVPSYPNLGGWNGVITVSGNTRVCDGVTMPPFNLTYTVTTGVMSPTMQLSATDTCAPGTYYQIRFVPSSGAPQTMYFTVPSWPTTTTFATLNPATAPAITNQTIPLSRLSQSGAAKGGIVYWNGSQYVPVSQSGAGAGYVPTRQSDGSILMAPVSASVSGTAPIVAASGVISCPTCLVDSSASGVLVRTATGVTTARTITGTANEITVTNADGVSGNPTLGLAATFDVSGKTSTKPIKSGTTAPATCSVGEFFFDTDATAGQNTYACTATNTWTLQSGGAATWGSITGTLSNQTDLQTALDAKAGSTHTHPASDIASGTIATARLGSGTADSTTFLRGDSTWATVSGGSLPSQTGNSGKYLTTDGSSASWGAMTAGSGLSKTCTGVDCVWSADSTVIPYLALDNAWLGNNTFAGTLDFSGASAVRIKTGTTVPASCTIGDVFFDTDATAGQNVYGCTATNTWTLQGDGGGGSSTAYISFPAANCQLGAAGTGFALPASLYPSPGCATGTNTLVGYLEWPDADGDYYAQATIPLTGTIASINVSGKWRTSATTGDVVIQLQTACFANGETVDPAWNTAQTITETAAGTTLLANDFSLTGLTLTGCSSGETMLLKILRNRTHASDTLAATFQLLSIGLTINR
jgi:hypothetical protein